MAAPGQRLRGGRVLTAAFALERVHKRFGGTVALAGVSLDGHPGEIIGLVGENGAGKSTLVKILSGVIPAGAFDGRLAVAGVERRFRSVTDAEGAGIVAIPQELALVPALSVAENIALGREPTRLGVVDYQRMHAGARAALARFDVDVDPSTPVGTLSVARQQVVEIARALSRQARILILDEPTASLTQTESERLFERLEDLRRRGICAIYISHRLDEIKRIADRVVVLRDGEVTAEGPAARLGGREIVLAMVGREPEGSRGGEAGRVGAEPVLEVEGLSVRDPANPGRDLLEGVTLTVRAGEILGIFGAVGAGRTELLATLYGAYPGARGGIIRVRGRPVRLDSPARALRLGVAMLTEDRKDQGLEPAMTVRENLTLATLGRLTRLGVVSGPREAAVAAAQVATLRIAAASIEEPVTALSGGNQQKVLIGRALLTEPSVLLLDEPTRGVDVGAKADIFRLLRGLAAKGVGIVMVSSEAPELLDHADRILVLRAGRVVAEREAREATEDQLLADAMGAGELAVGGP